MIDPWGRDEPPAPADVPELLGEGWQPLHDAPLYCLLPAAWPPQHRTWVPAPPPQVSVMRTTDQYYPESVPIDVGGPVDEEWEDDDWLADEARAAGLPEPPAERRWLLRSPWPRIPVTVIHEIVWAMVAPDRTHDEIRRVYEVARDVLTWDEARALAACPPATRHLLDAWAEAGRIGEAAAAVLAHRLDPDEVAIAMSQLGLDEAALVAWLDSLQSGLDDDVIAFISAWHEAGLPGDPPPDAYRFDGRHPAEVRAWLDAGFDLYAAAELRLAGLPTAIRWRDAGFSEADTYELLRSDPALTPDEARAFETAGAARERRRDWIYFGFAASEAGEWAAAGLTPTEARLWRATGNRPGDVRPGQHLPPQLTAGRTHIFRTVTQGGDAEYPEWDELPDPPGTRGRRARRWAGDDHPWINTD
jgi:hypothetical protein